MKRVAKVGIQSTDEGKYEVVVGVGCYTYGVGTFAKIAEAGKTAEMLVDLLKDIEQEVRSRVIEESRKKVNEVLE